MTLSASVVVITCARPHAVEQCLEHLARLDAAPHEVIVVDASPDDRTARLLAEHYPQVAALRNDLGPGARTESREIGLRAASGDIVAFLDDGACADPAWLGELVLPYADPSVGGVGGRAAEGTAGEESTGLGAIGKLLPDGRLTGNFGADPGRVIEVDHLPGATMSFRRELLLRLGGLRGGYPGTCLHEASDISLRVRARGMRLVYAPAALVRHAAVPSAAPDAEDGRRSARRDAYYARRNHVMLLARNYGWRAPILRAYVRTTLREGYTNVRESARRLAGRLPYGPVGRLRGRASSLALLARVCVEAAGFAAGLLAAAQARATDRRAGVATP